jgi:Ni/Fe-hydrogenase subunit HybB-like protein
LRQPWRTSINRFAEAMTLFAVACAALYPLIHLGRPAYFYYLIPYPSTTGMWPQVRSPLIWDFFAVGTYGTVSLLFWYVGLIPDLATLRDRARRRLAQVAYGVLAMGWRGSARHWRRYHDAYLLLAGLATPLVVSVHSIVSFDFAVGIVPGWHSTIFAPYFVAGAIYSGFAMVLTLAIPLRWAYTLHDLVTDRHLDNMAKVMLASGLVVAYGYLMEVFMGLVYSGNRYEQYLAINRFAGPYAFWYWLLIVCNVIVPQALWIRGVRYHVAALFVISLVINMGMWLERFIIIVGSLHRDYLPSSWRLYVPTIWDWSTFLGTLGLFGMLLFLFVRLLPMISISEVRELLLAKGEPSHGN